MCAINIKVAKLRKKKNHFAAINLTRAHTDPMRAQEQEFLEAVPDTSTSLICRVTNRLNELRKIVRDEVC